MGEGRHARKCNGRRSPRCPSSVIGASRHANVMGVVVGESRHADVMGEGRHTNIMGVVMGEGRHTNINTM